MSENTRHLRLARRALRAARTHLRDAANRTSMADRTRERVEYAALDLNSDIMATEVYEREANAHLEAMVRSRKKRGG